MLSAVRHAVARPALLALLIGALLFQPFGATALWSLPAVMAQVPLPDPTLLPVATILQVPLTVAYNALNVPAKPAGGWYLDPTTLVKIYKLTSATFPTSGFNWGHAYSEGGDEVSLPHTGSTRTIHLFTSDGSHWLIDFTPGVGISNPRPLTGTLAPWIDLAFTFSNNPATPYYAYVANGYPVTTIRRFDIRTMTEVPGGGWPVTGEDQACWLHQSENDAFFVWMRGANGSTVVGYEPATATLKTYTNPNLNEPRIDRAGRYVGISMSTPQNGLVVWDWLLNTVTWTTDGTIPFAHNASLKRRWITVDWNMTYPPSYSMFTADVPNSTTHIGGPANATLVHCNGNWIQSPANLNDQWAMCTHYGSLRPPETYWLAPGGMVLLTPNGQRRLLGHPYNTTSDYTFFSFAKFSPDGSYVLFTSDMNGSGRSDVFLAELPTSGSADTTPPTVALTAPAPGATVSGSAVPVTASASDNVGVAGVQFKLDGAPLGAEDTSAPFAISWNTTPASNGSHTLTAVARDAAGNTATSAAVSVTVANTDTTPPTVLLTAPANGATVSGSAVPVAASASDNVGVAGVQFKLDGATLGAEDTSAPFAISWNTTMASNGPHSLTAVARDAAGNTATSATVNVTVANVDTTPPVLSSIIVSSISLNTAAIIWTTNEPSDSQVEYGLTAGYGSLTALDPTLVTAHLQTLTGLTPGTLYHFRVRSRDAAGNLAVSGDLTLNTSADTSPPSVTVTSPGPGATISGTITVSSIASDNVGITGVQFMLDGANLGSEDTVAPYAVLWNTTTAANGSHTLTAVARDSAGNRTTSIPVGVTVGNAVPDTTPPAISSVATSSVISSGVTITWTTNEPANSQIEYGLSSGYGNVTPLDTQLVTSHAVSLSGLAAGTLYHYRVKSNDAAGNPAASSDLTVTTVGAGGTTPPVISSVAASSITSSSATISWTTNEAADSAVEYGVTMSYGSATPLDTSRVTAHTVTLSSLAAGTLQHYRVKSKDAAGNQAQSTDFSLTTAPATTDPPPPQDPGTPPTGTPSAQGSGTSGGAAPGGSGFASGGGGLAPSPALGNASGGTAPDLGAGVVSAGAAGAPIAGPVTAWSGAVPAQTQRVVWSSLVNVTSSGSSLTKISGCDGCADAGAVSKQQITTGDGYLEFTASETGSLRLIGFRNGNRGADRNEIQFAISLRPGSIAEVRELGIRRTNTTYVRGDVFRIAIVAGTVRYYKNGRLLYISGLPPAYPLTVGTSLMSRGATVTNAIISGRLSRGNALPVDTKPPEASIDVSPEGSQEPVAVAMSASVSRHVGPLVLNGVCLEGSALPMTAGRSAFELSAGIS